MSRSMLDEYIKSRMGESDLDKYGSGGVSARRNAVVRPNPVPRKNQTPVYRPERYSRPNSIVKAVEKASPYTTTAIPGIDAPTPDQEEGSNVLTWDEQIDIEIQNAAKKVLEVANKKFQYSSHESPIYSIMRQEYLKEADLAAGRATAAAAQNAGGFGSSFAVMAGEEARRQVMEGFYDQEDELYAAAQAEQASMFDNYLKLRELKAMEQERLAAGNPATMTLEDGTTVEVTDAARELYAGYLDSFTQGTGYDTLKTAMINGGASEADADQAIAMFKKLGGAKVADKISALETSPTLSGAAEAYIAAEQSGTLEKNADRISKSARISLENALKTDGADAEAIMAEGAQAVKDGYLSEDDYLAVVIADAHADIKEMETSGKNLTERKKQKRIAQNVEGILDMYNAGQISENMYYKALLEMKPYLDKYFSSDQRKFASELGGLSDGEAEAIYDVVQALEKQKIAKASAKGAKGATAVKERS